MEAFTSKPSIRSPKNITTTKFKYSIIIPLCHRKLTFNNRHLDVKTHTCKPRNSLAGLLSEWLLPTKSSILSTAPHTTQEVWWSWEHLFQELTPSFWELLEVSAFSEYTTVSQSCASCSSAQGPQRIRDCANYRSSSDKTKNSGPFYVCHTTSKTKKQR